MAKRLLTDSENSRDPFGGNADGLLGHGALSDEEDAEYRTYLDDAEVISLMQAKARRIDFGMHD